MSVPVGRHQEGQYQHSPLPDTRGFVSPGEVRYGEGKGKNGRLEYASKLERRMGARDCWDQTRRRTVWSLPVNFPASTGHGGAHTHL